MKHDETCEHASFTRPTDSVKVKKPALKSKLASAITVVDGELATKELYVHQIEGIEQYKDKTAIPLFWEMGTGKSATSLKIAQYKYEKGDIDSLLIIAPNDVHVQWATQEVPLWLTCDYQIQCLYGRGGQKKAYPFDDKGLQIVSVNVDTFSTKTKWMEIADWVNARKAMIILDEATCIKNISSQRTQHILYGFNTVEKKGKVIKASMMNTVARVILTGTPVTNSSMDLWSMMEFIWPNFFGRNWYSFQNHFGLFTFVLNHDGSAVLTGNGRPIKAPVTYDTWTGIKTCKSANEAHALFGCSEDTYNVIQSQEKYMGPFKNTEELRDKVASIASFKLLTDCVSMPEKNYQIRTLLMSKEQAQCYRDMQKNYIASYNDHEASALSKMAALIRLQQISSGFIYDKDYDIKDIHADSDDSLSLLYGLDITPDDPVQWIGTSNPKLDALYSDIEEVSKPLIIITKYSAEAKRIYDDLYAKYSCCLMTGWKKIGTIEEFQQGKYQIMVANIRVVAKGFNLQNSNTILFYSNTYSLEDRQQAEGRIFRIGQKNTCNYVDYANSGTVDQKIMQSLHNKRNLLDYIRGTSMEDLVS
jgi:SNF2 family DNA or RNA helicase